MKKTATKTLCGMAVALAALGSPALAASASAETYQGDTTDSSNDFQASRAGLLNGYNIRNDTGEKLILKGKRQGRDICMSYTLGDVCSTHSTYGSGYGATPPSEINTGEVAYFEIPAFTGFGDTKDATELVYETVDSKKEIRLYAGVHYSWVFGIHSKLSDTSKVRTATSTYDRSTEFVAGNNGSGTQTDFILKPNLLL